MRLKTGPSAFMNVGMERVGEHSILTTRLGTLVVTVC